MAYANTNTNQALRDVRSMVASMPENRSMREYRSSLGRGAELQAMAGLKESEMRLPSIKLQKEQAQTELDQMNAPFKIQNLARGVGEEGPTGPYDVRVYPDQAAMLVQDQKYGPPAMTQFLQNVQSMGYTQAQDGSFLNKDGSPVAYKDAAPIHREWLRTMFMNTDMEKHRDNQVAFLKSKGDLAPEDAQKLQKLESLSPLQLSEMRLKKLQEIQLEDPMWNRPEGKLLQPMIDQAKARVDELKGLAAKQSDRNWDIMKMEHEYGLKGGLEEKKASAASAKDSSTNDMKWAKFLSEVKGIPINDAVDMVRNDKTMPERLRLAQEELGTYEMDFMSMEPAERQQIIDSVFRKYGLDSGKKEGAAQVQDNDPLGIR